MKTENILLGVILAFIAYMVLKMNSRRTAVIVREMPYYGGWGGGWGGNWGGWGGGWHHGGGHHGGHR